MSQNPFIPDENLDMLRDTARRHLAREWPATKAVALANDPAAQRAAWKGAAQQGWTALGAEEGAGGLREIVVLMQELGRGACPLPIAEAFVANALMRGCKNAKHLDALRRGLEDGSACLALAVAGSDVKIGAGKGGATVRGMVRFVEGFQIATHVLVVSEAERKAAVVVAGAGASATATPGYAVPALSDVLFEDAPATILDGGGDVTGTSALMRLACAARAYGAAARSTEVAIDHAKTRVAFGQPIGKFQAIQHKLANSHIALEGTRLLLLRAAAAFDGGDPGWLRLADAAFSYGSPAIRQVMLEAHHTLAGLGYFEEHELPRHFRRVHADLVRYGGVHAARAGLAAAVLGGAKPTEDIDLGPEANAFRQEIRAFLAQHWSPEKARAARSMEFNKDADFTEALVAKGWLGVAWPKKFGGQERSLYEQFVFSEEMGYHDAPMSPFICATDLIGPALMEFGTKEQCEQFLPRFQRGEMTLCLGYSEPEVGSDLAGLRTKAVRDGDGWVINGQKLYTTMGEFSSHIWLAVRTDPDAPKHKGITVFIVPSNAPGITFQPMRALHGGTACATFLDNVRVGPEALVGKVNEGWKVITAALAHERIVMGAVVNTVRAAFDELVQEVKRGKRGDRPMRDDPLVLERLGTLAAELEAARSLAVNTIAMLCNGKVPYAEAPMSKVFSGELEQRMSEAVFDIFGPGATLSAKARGAEVGGTFEWMLRRAIMSVVGGGTNEIQRNLIATVGLGLPR